MAVLIRDTDSKGADILIGNLEYVSNKCETAF